MQSMIRLAEDSIPRTSENIVIAIGALCSVRHNLDSLEIILVCFSQIHSY